MVLHLLSSQQADFTVVGGGAAGFMAAITAAESGVKNIFVLEATSKVLEKVRISGGGRCNVTHASWVPKDLAVNYPRGKVHLLGPFSKFATGDVVSWFAEHGLLLLEEKDGRMFPESNKSSDVVKCLRDSAIEAGVVILTNKNVVRIKSNSTYNFEVITKTGEVINSKNVLIATGGSRIGKELAESLGHNIKRSVPSLFSFCLKQNLLSQCVGISIDNVSLKLIANNKTFLDNGSILITHKGLSGPAILRLSAFAANELYEVNYKSKLYINWINETNASVTKLFNRFRYDFGRKKLFSSSPYVLLPKRLWLNFLVQSDIENSARWADLRLKQEKNLINLLINSQYLIFAKGPYGEEFVTAGGVNLDEVNLACMQSKLCKGLFFAGEILNIDGITGGFNFQHCWTSGWLVGKAVSEKN
tara:strand:- start:3595 stop:4845 length:1251 start_codon:yes stop_codon:yes gene_type:complete